jgi:hypothetical protein
VPCTCLQGTSWSSQELLPPRSLTPCINLWHIFRKENFFWKIVGRNWNVVSLVVGIHSLSSSIVMQTLMCYLPLDNIFSLNWRCRNLFTSYTLHSPHSFPGYVVFWGEALVKSPTLHFPMSTQLAVVEKVHMDATRISCHTPPLHVPLCMLLDWRSLLSIQLLRKIKPREHGLLLPAGFLTMAFLSTKITCLCIPTIVYGMASLLAVVTHKKFLV